MRYYCKNCESELILTKEWAGYCPACGDGEIRKPIPNYETPEQYEKRTGSLLPDYAAVWVSSKYEESWELYYYSEAKSVRNNDLILCVQGVNPPPDDWEQEVTE